MNNNKMSSDTRSVPDLKTYKGPLFDVINYSVYTVHKGKKAKSRV